MSTFFSASGASAPPPMASHTSTEFAFAQRVLQKLVLGSDFFPPEAEATGWFRCREDVALEVRERMKEEAEKKIREAFERSERNQAAKRAEQEQQAQAKKAEGEGDGEQQQGEEGGVPPLRRSSASEDGDGGGEASKSSPEEGGEASSKNTSTEESKPEPGKGERDILAAAAEAREVAMANRAPVHSVHESELDYGSVLGTGGFCEVRLAFLRQSKACSLAGMGKVPGFGRR